MTATIHELKPKENNMPEKIFYFQKWVWKVACQRQPEKYSYTDPMYQGCRVVLT